MLGGPGDMPDPRGLSKPFPGTRQGVTWGVGYFRMRSPGRRVSWPLRRSSPVATLVQLKPRGHHSVRSRHVAAGRRVGPQGRGRPWTTPRGRH